MIWNNRFVLVASLPYVGSGGPSITPSLFMFVTMSLVPLLVLLAWRWRALEYLRSDFTGRRVALEGTKFAASSDKPWPRKEELHLDGHVIASSAGPVFRLEIVEELRFGWAVTPYMVFRSREVERHESRNAFTIAAHDPGFPGIREAGEVCCLVDVDGHTLFASKFETIAEGSTRRRLVTEISDSAQVRVFGQVLAIGNEAVATPGGYRAELPKPVTRRMTESRFGPAIVATFDCVEPLGREVLGPVGWRAMVDQVREALLLHGLIVVYFSAS